MPPVVQSLEQILAELETAYAPVRDIYNRQSAAIPAKFENRRTGLEGARVKNFDAIATQANRAGMGFTGFTAAEQGDYLADKYLPGIQQTYLDQDEEGLGIAKSLAQLDLEKRTTGMSRRESQEKELRGFQEAERQRAFQAEQARLEREAQAAEASRSRAAASAGSKITKSQLRQGAISFLEAGKGKDGKVSPERFLQAKSLWLDEGGSEGEFNSAFRNYVNKSHEWDYGFGSKPKSGGGGGQRYATGRLANNPTF